MYIHDIMIMNSLVIELEVSAMRLWITLVTYVVVPATLSVMFPSFYMVVLQHALGTMPSPFVFFSLVGLVMGTTYGFYVIDTAKVDLWYPVALTITWLTFTTGLLVGEILTGLAGTELALKVMWPVFGIFCFYVVGAVIGVRYCYHLHHRTEEPVGAEPAG